MSTILADLDGMFPDRVTVTSGAPNYLGDFVASGATLSPKCRIEGEAKLVRDASGREVVSRVQILVAGAHNLTTDRHRYTLPTRFSPRSDLQAIAIVKESDEDGACYEEVQL